MQKTLPPIPEKTLGILRQAADSLLNLYGSRLKHLFLFGSYARRKAQPESDVDRLEVPRRVAPSRKKKASRDVKTALNWSAGAS